MSILNYILKNRIPVVEPDTEKWLEWKRSKKHYVKVDKVKKIKISTVFLGVNYNISGEGPPLLFETMIFANGEDEIDHQVKRTSTYEEAETAHREMCEEVQDYLKFKESMND